MKFLFVLLGLLLTVALSSAFLSITFDAVCSCIPINDCHEVTLSQKVIGSWTDSPCGKTYTQYDVTIKNNLNRDVKNIFIGTDHTLNLRDSSSIWNIVRLPNGVLTLPSYQPSINAGASFTFGFILEGTKAANLNILAVTF
ncbi:hypothetical protein DICPUDRAFT_94401 [Dictyostelium purpureum]|uniref:Carbohydrate binding domain-containing protein n=1 Tax=Dictyostelium purpureum TaxID=5786 RepID=F0ZJ39_DICPU|nr:uncharacterized protein DICPUDRAFT_94401 [Dictyostelium purpureum]EGC36061.1 hypothetical protein DICPUDRAFT_94401 [Dictyostelium purpureum]|eukprot:XP_003287436.1 hypothetical protein DICPUDRAFT_94401 [Dictyostelium purpureum]